MMKSDESDDMKETERKKKGERRPKRNSDWLLQKKKGGKSFRNCIDEGIPD